ncbi:MAG: hypothetical protein VXW65_00105 [Pseudomonadota bacterium]|nr:hypothetical protein [Pseudomonadota bacterium]
MQHWRLVLIPLSRVRLSVLVLVCLCSGSVSAHSHFVQIMVAEFSLARGDIAQATHIYREQALHTTTFNILDRALFIALDKQQFDDALEISKHWVDVHPEHIPALFYLAHLALRAHEYPLAGQTLDRILSYDPDAALDRILEGIYPESPEDRNELLAALQQLDSRNNPSLLVMSAGLLSDNDQLPEALEKVNTALRKRPQVAAFITLKANILIRQQRHEEVARFLLKQVKQQSNNKSLGLFYTRYLLGQKRQVDALQHLDRMAKRWPQDGEIILLAALVSIDQNRPIDAEKYLFQLLTQDAYIDQAYYYLGINAERLNRPEAAEVYFKKVQREDLYRRAQQKIALLRVAYDRLQDALTGLTQERIDHPEHASFLYLLQAQLLNENGQRERARNLLDEALVSMPDQPELIYSRLTLLEPHETQQMEHDLAHLLKLEPDNSTYLNAYAYALVTQNRALDQARRLAERANQLAPNQAPILDTLGLIALRQKRLEDAYSLLKRAYLLDARLNIGLRLAEVLLLQQKSADYHSLIQDLQRRFPDDEHLKSIELNQPAPTDSSSVLPTFNDQPQHIRTHTDTFSR